MTMLRNILCWVMLAVFPMSLLAANTGAAMLYAKGTAWINGATAPSSSAIFPGDLVQTKPASMANINASGSSVMVLADSLVKFEGDSVAIDHGGVTVTTTKGLRTSAEDLTISPASNSWTEFDVNDDANGKVVIVARKGDVSIDDGSTTTTLPQGQQTTRDESASKKHKRGGNGAAPAAGGGILDSPIIVAAGGAAIGALITWVAIQSPTPSSPSRP